MKKALLIFAGISFFFISSQAQNGDNLPSDEIEVIKNFEARLAVSDKLGLPPTLPSNKDKTVNPLQYVIYPESMKIEYDPPKIRPLALKSKKQDPGYKAYAELGYGYPNSPYAMAAFEHNADDWGIGVGFNHYSAKDKEINHLAISQTGGSIKANYVVKDQFNVFGGIDMGFDKRYYNLAYNDSLPPVDSTEFRKINQFSIHAGINNNEETQLGIDYRVKLKFHNASDDLETSQNLFETEFSFVKYLNDKNPIGLEFGNYLSTYKTLEFQPQEFNSFYANPFFKFGFDKFGFRIGADIWSQNNQARVFPDIDLIVNLRNNELILFAESEGTYTPIDFIQNIDKNPFLSPGFTTTLEDVSTSFQEVFEIAGGIRGNFNGINYSLKGGHQSINNLPLFVNNIDDPNKFLIEYDTATNVFINLNIDYSVNTDLLLFATLNKNFYSLENNEQVLHTPEFRLELGGKYWTFDKKLVLGLKAFVENGLYYRNELLEVEQMDGLLDMSFDAKYYFTDHFGAFVQLNNITNNKREKLHLYPSFGFNALGGIILRF